MVQRLLVLYRLLQRRRGTAFLATLGLVLVALLGNAIVFHRAEATPQGGPSFEDALWYSVISITTIGYGDLSATTTASRLGTFVFIVVIGLSAFTVFLGLMIDVVGEAITRGARGMMVVKSREHVLIVHFPSEERVARIVSELRSDAEHRDRDIVVISDRIERLPPSLEGVDFVRGSPLHEETLRRAGGEHAALAIVLAVSYDDPHSDAVVASAASLVDRLRPEIHLVAELLDEKKRSLFEAVRCDAVVPVLGIGGNLLVQEGNDPGVARAVEVMTSNAVGLTLHSTAFEAAARDEPIGAIAAELLQIGITPLAVVRDHDALTDYHELKVVAGDRLVYLAQSRLPSARLRIGAVAGR